MGFIISLVGTHRYAYRYSTYLLHDISLEIGGNARSIKEKMEETDGADSCGNDGTFDVCANVCKCT